MPELNNEFLDRIVNLRKRFDEIVAKHSDDEGFINSVNSNLEENEFLTADKIREDYLRNTDSERLLKIGIVGGVKAGKSSLLNALFFEGNDILPKAATPMTAALTELTYGENVKITVDFFTDSDIEILKEGHETYLSLFEKYKKNEYQKNSESWLKQQKLRDPEFNGDPSSEDIERWKKVSDSIAKRKLGEHLVVSGAYEQYEMILEAKVERKTESESFSVPNINELKGKLEDYVGSSGKYMPFTSRVSLELPIEDLKGICVIDTPGFNDPVPSRDERARKSLRECDVVLILSRAGQFLTANDKEVIQKITTKNGIRELFLVQSQIDLELFNDEFIEFAKGDMNKAVDEIVNTLNNVTKNNLSDINLDGVFTELINNTDERSYPTSGLCQSMAQTIDDKNHWDDGRKKDWENLTIYYPDYFSDGDIETSRNSLKKLGNIEKIYGAILVVKEKKSEIFKEKLATFENKYQNAAKAVKEKILGYIASREEELQKNDIKKIEKQISSLQKMYDSIAPELDESFEDTVREWYEETKTDYDNFLKQTKDDAKTGIANAKSSRTETWQTTTGHLWWKEYQNHSKNITIANISSIKNSIADYKDAFEDYIPHYMETQYYRLSKKIVSNIVKTWTTFLSESGIEMTEENSLVKVRNKTRAVFQDLHFSCNINIQETEFSPDLNDPKPSGILWWQEYHNNSDSDSGSIEGNKAKKYLESANEYVRKLNSSFKSALNNLLDETLSKAKSCGFSKLVLESYILQLEKAKTDLQQPKLAIENFKRMKKEIEEIS